MAENTRPRGVVAYLMPEEVCGPFDRYALVVRHEADDSVRECRMVHTEGVAYLVTDEKPWKWDDYNEGASLWSMEQLMEACDGHKSVDLADWVRTFGARLENNFYQIYRWATK